MVEPKGISIGIIGPEPIVRRVLQVIRAFPSFHPIPCIAYEEQEASRMALSLEGRAEAILVAGPLRIRKAAQPARVPVHHLPLTDNDFFKAFLKLQNSCPKVSAISVDTLPQSMAEACLAEVREKTISVTGYREAAFPGTAELIAFHKKLYEDGRTDASMTGDKAVSEALSELGIPNEWIVPANQTITVALERALLSTETRQSKESQIVVGIVNVDEFGRRVRDSSEHQVQRMKLDLHRMLLDYVESLDGYLTPLGGDEYLFFTTRGIFERETGGYKRIPLAKDAEGLLGVTLSVGIGFGRSAGEAGSHARAALRSAKEAGGNTCFIVREEGTLIGPLEMTEPIRHDLSVRDTRLLEAVQEAGMTRAYLSKLLSHTARTGKLDFQVHELASLLGITVRTAHRLLLQWTDGGLVSISGLEKVPKGRPRQIYRFAFLEDQIGTE